MSQLDRNKLTDVSESQVLFNRSAHLYTATEKASHKTLPLPMLFFCILRKLCKVFQHLIINQNHFSNVEVHTCMCVV